MPNQGRKENIHAVCVGGITLGTILCSRFTWLQRVCSNILPIKHKVCVVCMLPAMQQTLQTQQTLQDINLLAHAIGHSRAAPEAILFTSVLLPVHMIDDILGGIQARGGLQCKWGWRGHHESLPCKGMLPAYVASGPVCG